MSNFDGSTLLLIKSRFGFGTRLAQKHPLWVFFVLAYVLSWLVFLPMIVLHAPMELSVPASFGPCAAALITHKLHTGNFRAFRFVGSLRHSVLAACSGVVLIVLAYVVLPGVVTANPSKLNWSILLSTTVYNYSTLLGGPLGEEGGWRGYALPRLEARLGSVPARAITGLGVSILLILTNQGQTGVPATSQECDLITCGKAA